MVYDCMCYNGEDELLEIRINELDSIVDRFVICESTHTFSGQPKKLMYQNHLEYFGRVTYLVYDEKPTSNAMLNAYKQNDYLINGLKEAKDDDIVLINDIDEIPNKNNIKDVDFTYVCKMGLYQYYFNYKMKDYWLGTVVTKKKDIDYEGSINNLRERRFEYPVEEGGWHFSFLGSPERIARKIRSYGHQEFNTRRITDLKRIQSRIKNKRDVLGRWWKLGTRISYVPLDNTFPEYILENQDKFKELIAND